MTLRLGGDGAITGCTSLENPDLTVSGLTISGSFDAEKVLVASGTAAAPSYTFSGDTDNGLYYAGTNSVGVSTAGTSAIVVDSSQRVLVGTTNTGGASTYYDDLVISNTDAGTGCGITLFANATNGFNAIDFGDTDAVGRGRITYSHADDSLRIDTAGSEQLRIDSSGNVGIGTTTFPANGTNLKTSDGTIARNILEKTGSNARIFEIGNGGTFLNVYDATADAERLRIDSSGNVGIGTTLPRGIIHVGADLSSGATDAAAINLKQTSTTASTGIYLERSGERKGYSIYVGGAQDSLTFQRNNAGTKADVMVLTRDGNVGIGTTSPAHPLHVSSNTGVPGLFVNTAAVNVYLKFQNSDNARGHVGYETKRLAFYADNGSNTGDTRVAFMDADGLKFFNDTAAANALDDYEEGSWTPSFQNDNGGTYGTRVGVYIKVGKLVMATFMLQYSNAGSSSGAVAVTGFPFVALNSTGIYAMSSSVHGTGWAVTRNSLNILIPPGQTITNPVYYNMAAAGSSFGLTQHSDLGTGNLLATLVYRAN